MKQPQVIAVAWRRGGDVVVAGVGEVRWGASATPRYRLTAEPTLLRESPGCVREA